MNPTPESVYEDQPSPSELAAQAPVPFESSPTVAVSAKAMAEAAANIDRGLGPMKRAADWIGILESWAAATHVPGHMLVGHQAQDLADILKIQRAVSASDQRLLKAITEAAAELQRERDVFRRERDVFRDDLDAVRNDGNALAARFAARLAKLKAKKPGRKGKKSAKGKTRAR